MEIEKSNWKLTNVNWEVSKVIWSRWALGDTVKATKTFLELHSEDYPSAPLDRTTITKVREEISRMPIEICRKLIREVPETRYLVSMGRPDLQSILSETRTKEELPSYIQHDIDIFQKATTILSDKDLSSILLSIDETMLFRDSDLSKIWEYLLFFDLPSNLYSDANLRYLCHISTNDIRNVFSILEIDSCERMYLSDELGDEEYRYDTDSWYDQEYTLLPGVILPLYRHLKQADPEYLREKKDRYRLDLQQITARCRNSYENYRSAVRDTLFQ